MAYKALPVHMHDVNIYFDDVDMYIYDFKLKMTLIKSTAHAHVKKYFDEMVIHICF